MAGAQRLQLHHLHLLGVSAGAQKPPRCRWGHAAPLGALQDKAEPSEEAPLGSKRAQGKRGEVQRAASNQPAGRVGWAVGAGGAC